MGILDKLLKKQKQNTGKIQRESNRKSSKVYYHNYMEKLKREGKYEEHLKKENLRIKKYREKNKDLINAKQREKRAKLKKLEKAKLQSELQFGDFPSRNRKTSEPQ